MPLMGRTALPCTWQHVGLDPLVLRLTSWGAHKGHLRVLPTMLGLAL
jgi:hypothetical protein